MAFASGARVTLLATWIQAVIQVVALIALARLLDPNAFGIVAMVAVVVAIATLFADFGLSLAALQASLLSQAQKSALFLVNLGAGVVGAAAVCASGPLLAWFYGEPAVASVAAGLSLALLFSSLGVQFRVEINRDRRFGTLAVQDVAGAFAGLALAVVVALLGFGYWALVAQTVTQAAVIAVLGVIQSRWLPTRPARWAEITPFLKFGGNNLAVQLLNLASRSADVMALGRAQGADVVGLYSRASQIISLTFQQFVSPLTRVVLPRLSTAADDRDFTVTVMRLQSTIAYTLPGGLSALIAFGPAALTVVLGSDWAPAGPPLQVLALGGVFAAVGYIYYWVFLARARTALLLATEAPGRFVMIVAAVVVAPAGAVAVAYAILAGQIITFVAANIAASRLGVNAWSVLRASLLPILMWGMATTAALVSQGTVSSPFSQLLVGMVAWTFTASAFLVLPHVRRDVMSIVALIRAK